MTWVQCPEVKMYHWSEHCCSLAFCLVHALATCGITTDAMQPTKPEILRICPYPIAPSESNKLDRGVLWQSKGSCSPRAPQRPQVRLGPASSSMRPLAGQMTPHIRDQREEIPQHENHSLKTKWPYYPRYLEGLSRMYDIQSHQAAEWGQESLFQKQREGWRRDSVTEHMSHMQSPRIRNVWNI